MGLNIYVRIHFQVTSIHIYKGGSISLEMNWQRREWNISHDCHVRATILHHSSTMYYANEEQKGVG